MRILVDMGLPPAWCGALAAEGHDALHWSAVGDPRAPDETLMHWAEQRGYAVFTHDLDFTAILASTHARGPSVLQLRAQDVLPERMLQPVLRVLREHAEALASGAVISIDEARARVRVLPFAPHA